MDANGFNSNFSSNQFNPNQPDEVALDRGYLECEEMFCESRTN